MTSRTFVPSSTTSIPITFAVPEVGLRIVQRIIRRVVFPEPLGPRITIISPSSTVKFRPRRASVFPYLFERLIVSTANKDSRELRKWAIKMFERRSSNNSLDISGLRKDLVQCSRPHRCRICSDQRSDHQG